MRTAPLMADALSLCSASCHWQCARGPLCRRRCKLGDSLSAPPLRAALAGRGSGQGGSGVARPTVVSGTSGRARSPRCEPGMGMIPDPRQIGDGEWGWTPDPRQIYRGWRRGWGSGVPCPGLGQVQLSAGAEDRGTQTKGRQWASIRSNGAHSSWATTVTRERSGA